MIGEAPRRRCWKSLAARLHVAALLSSHPSRLAGRRRFCSTFIASRPRASLPMFQSSSIARWLSMPATFSAVIWMTISSPTLSAGTHVRWRSMSGASRTSKRLTADPMPKVIISASGMATGGRVLHHLKHYAPDAKNTILFAGFQAAGTRGAAMVAGAESVKIHGEKIPIRAEVHNLEMLSAHADADEILRWLGGFAKPPLMTFVVHGEPSASDALRHRIETELGWRCLVPDHGQQVELA